MFEEAHTSAIVKAVHALRQPIEEQPISSVGENLSGTVPLADIDAIR